MILDDATTRARAILDEHGLTDWRIVWDQRKRRLGACRYADRTIRLSAPWIIANGPDVLDDTVRHEAAHALAGPTAGHGPLWRAACATTGARPERCADGSKLERPPAPYVLACPVEGCPARAEFYRRPTRTRKCRRHGVECVLEISRGAAKDSGEISSKGY